MPPKERPDDEDPGEQVQEGMEGPGTGPAGTPTTDVDERRLQVEGQPIVQVRIPKPPDRGDDKDSGPGPDRDRGANRRGRSKSGSGRGGGIGSGLRVVDRFPSTLGRWIFGVRDEHGGIKLGLISKRYPERADEIILDPEDCDLLDEAFVGPFKKLLKLLGLTSEEMAMIVVGILVLLPRVGIIAEEETQRAKDRKAAEDAGSLIDHGGKK